MGAPVFRGSFKVRLALLWCRPDSPGEPGALAEAPEERASHPGLQGVHPESEEQPGEVSGVGGIAAEASRFIRAPRTHLAHSCRSLWREATEER